MRIDKYLWCVRLFKTRPDAADALRMGRVSLNGQPAKASRVVSGGDVISLRRGVVQFAFRVKGFPKGRVGARLVPDYLQDVTPREELEKLELARLQVAAQRARGTGRPTKRERRELEAFTAARPMDDGGRAELIANAEAEAALGDALAADDLALYALLHGDTTEPAR